MDEDYRSLFEQRFGLHSGQSLPEMLDAIADRAARGSGADYEVYTDRFTDYADAWLGYLPPGQRDAAQELLRDNYDYNGFDAVENAHATPMQDAAQPTSPPDLAIRIDSHEDGRLIAYTNGHEVDIQANEDGVCVAICRDGIVHTTAKMNWNEPHISERPQAWEQFHASAHAPPAQDAAQPEQASHAPEL
jgi:hypothetical protein